jgi:hypothetical protein
MWVVGILILFAVSVTAVVAIGWTPRPVPSPPLWDIPGVGQMYTGIVGTIAGFSVASAIFIAGLEANRSSPEFITVIGMLLVAFLILVFAALQYASAPNIDDRDDAAQTLSHVLANMCGCLGLALSWLALVPLLEMIHLPSLAATFIWLLLFVALAGGGWTALFAYRLTTANAAACLAIPVLGFALPALYRLVAVRLMPELWPATDVALQFTYVAFSVSGLVFAAHSWLLLTHGDKSVQQLLWRDGHRLALACSAAAVLAAGLTWFAVALP